MTADRRTSRLKTALADALGPALERGPGDADPHPRVEELMRYHGGELEAAEAERVQDHLLVCPECMEDLLDLDGFIAAGAARTEGTGESAGAGGAEPSDSASGAGGRRLAWALAASILVAVVGLGTWAVQERRVADLRSQVAELSAPRPDVPIVDLLPAWSVRGESAARAPAEVPPGEDFVTFVLNLPQAAGLSGFEADLVAPGGEVLWSGPVERSRYGTFTLGVWSGRLPAGENEIRVYGVEDGRRRLLETYAFRVEPDEEGR